MDDILNIPDPVIVDLSNQDVLDALFGICNTKEELLEHIRTFLGIDLPDTTIDADSTSNPAQFVWDCYDYMRTGRGASRHVAACCRNGYKTLSTAIVQFYVLNHFRRDSIQISAEVQQSLSAISYVDSFFRLEELKVYSDTDNARKKTIRGLPKNELTSRTDASLKVVTATKKGANSSRGSCFVGKTEILGWPSDEDWALNKGDPKNRKGRLQKITLDGLWSRMKRGEEVYTPSVNPKTTQIERKKIIAINRKIELDRLVIETNSGKKIECTVDHPIATEWTGADFVYTQAKDLAVGSRVIINRGSISFQKNIELDTIKSISRRTAKESKRERWVYDIQVADNHNFFANGVLAHNCLIYDETDLISREILGESAYIADPERFTGYGPISIYISSRKSNDGPLQDLIDENDKDHPEDLKVHKWSIVDLMKHCPPDVYKADKPIKAFLHNETLEVQWGEERFDALIKEGRTAWKEINAFEGCQTCPAFIACQSRAMNQTADKKTLRDRFFVGDVLKKVMKTGGPNMVVAQTLNMKPDVSSLVFSVFKAERNVAKPIEFFKWVAGYYWSPSPSITPDLIEEIIEHGDDIQLASITPTKLDIYGAMKKTGWVFNLGVDWGLYDPAVANVVGYHKASRRAAFLHLEASSGFSNPDWAEYCKKEIHSQYPVDLVCPDMADASSPIYFGRGAIKLPCRDKKPAKIETGVAQLRSLLFNPFTQKSHLMILDDGEFGQNKYLIECFQKWTYLKTANGFNFNKFEDNEWTHGLDSSRYALDPFINDMTISTSFSQKLSTNSNLTQQAIIASQSGDKAQQAQVASAIEEQNRVKNIILDRMQREHGVVGDPFAKQGPTANKKSDKGSIKFRF